MSATGILGGLQAYAPGGILSAGIAPPSIDPSQFALPQLPPQQGSMQAGILNYGAGSDMAPSSPLPQLDPQQTAAPTAPKSDFWSQPNPDGTTSYLGGTFKYDPTKDVGGSRLGMFGAALQDMSAHLAGQPEYATNLKDFVQTAKKQQGQQMLVDMLGGAGGGDNSGAASGSLPPLSTGAPLSQNLPGNLPRLSPPPVAGQGPPNMPPPLTASPTSLPQLPRVTQQQPGQTMSLQSLAPKLARAAAADVDISPVVAMLKDMQPKYSQTVNYTKDGAPYTVGDDGSVKWLDPSITPRDKIEIAGNGEAYNAYTTAPGADFSDRSKPFDSVTGAANAPVQKFEMNKVMAPAQLRANVDMAKMGQDNYSPPTTIGFTGPDGEEKQVAAVWDKRRAQYLDAGTGQPIVNPKGLRVVGNATGGARSQAAISRVLTSAEDATSGIENLSGINAKGSGGMFPNLETTPLSSLGRRVTSQEVQDVQATMAGLGRAMGGLATGGLAVDQNTQKSYEGLALNDGDTQLTKMRKLAELRQQSTNALDVQAVSPILTNDQKSKAAALSARIKAAVPWTVADVQALENTGNSNLSMRDLAQQRLKQTAPAGTSRGVKWKIVSPGGQ